MKAVICAITLSLLLGCVVSFSPSATTHVRVTLRTLASRSDGDAVEDFDDDDEDDIADLSDRDWRSFRAKLVMSEPSGDEEESDASSSSTLSSGVAGEFMEDDLDGIGAVFASKSSTIDDDVADGGTAASTETAMCPSKFTPLEPDQWAYDSGKVIEQGAIILGGVDQEFGFGLRQQYFHKSVILVLDHDEAQFTKGIILNKPSDKYLDDDLNKGLRWKMWFGGDVQGLDTIMPEIVCLHSLSGPDVDEVSKTVMKDIKWTTFDNAKKLVKAGQADQSDFWVFAGYAGWGPSQLMGELERKSWYMCATDSQTLLKELARQSEGADPLDAGLDVWELLMNMIGRGDTAEECSGGFDDLMLKEWSRKNLRSEEDKIGGETKELLAKASALVAGDAVMEGSVLRSSSMDRSPFLLSKQELHKSLILVISDDEQMTVGVILNRPVARGIELGITDKITKDRKEVKIPLRFGGEYAIKGSESMLWLHCNSKLRDSNIGCEVGPAPTGIWKCTQDEATDAIGKGIASPNDFLIVSGVSVWPKVGALAQGMQGEVAEGRFESVPQSQIPNIWGALKEQDVLTKLNFVQNVARANKAWSAAAVSGSSSTNIAGDKEDVVTTTEGIGEGFDEEDDTYVHKTSKKVAELSDQALQSWVATFLLGAPSLGH